MDEGKIVLGGCCITDNDPQFQCNNCHAKIFDDGSFEFDKEFEELIAIAFNLFN